MHYSNVMLSDCTTYHQCNEAIEKIESDWANYQGGLQRWISGHETHLLAGAKKKVAALQKKSDRLFDKAHPDHDTDGV